MHRDTILTPATMTGLALLALATLTGGPSLATRAMAQASPPAQSRPQAQPPGSPAQGSPAQGSPAQPPGQGAGQGPAQGPRPTAPPNAGTGGGRGAAQVGRNRRPSYAACNRISHARGLRGGARRRFLVRCKLGFDRPRAGQPQAAPARQSPLP